MDKKFKLRAMKEKLIRSVYENYLLEKYKNRTRRRESRAALIEEDDEVFPPLKLEKIERKADAKSQDKNAPNCSKYSRLSETLRGSADELEVAHVEKSFLKELKLDSEDSEEDDEFDPRSDISGPSRRTSIRPNRRRSRSYSPTAFRKVIQNSESCKYPD